MKASVPGGIHGLDARGVIDVRDGKIFRNLDFYDSATIMRQVGLLPAQATDAK